MAELYTYRPKKGIGKDLPEEELKEFNSITYDKIMNLTNIKKLMRLEQYMREEEFTQTSQLARKRIVDLGGKDMFPNEYDPQFCDVDAEINEFMKNYDTWQESMKEADNNLLEMHESKQEEQPSMTVEPLSKKNHKRPLIVNNSKNRDIMLEKPKKKKDVRSGRFYYEQWDKYATDAEKEIKDEEEKANNKNEEKQIKVDNTSNKNTIKKETLQQRLLAIGKSKSMTEREWFSEREREKGNDLFKAKEYSASIDAYNMAIELFPESPLAYGNRGASNIKLKKWEDVIKDCCIAIELDGKYMKAYMRRGLANLEMNKPKEAMIDLERALELDPINQETHTIIRRAQFMIKNLEEKHAIEVELERKRKEEVEFQERKKETEMFKSMTYSSFSSQNLTRMAIEEVEDSDVKEASNLQEYEINVENNFANKNDDAKIAINESLVPQIERNNLNSKKILNWSNRPEKYNMQSKDLQNGDETIVNSMEDNENCKNITHNIRKDEKNKVGTFDSINDYQFKNLAYNNVDEEESMFSKLCDVDVPFEITEAINTQELVPKDHVAFGCDPNKHQLSLVLVSNPKIEPKPHLKASNNMLAEEWRLNGNSYFSQGKFHDAIQCYTTSLNYKQSVAAYSNRAISQIKLKNFKGAEEDATHAISIDCKFHKAYYRRGLARYALGNLQGAKLDFEEVLKFIPNNEEVIQHLVTIDSEYIPMRSGPMIIEEIKEDEESIETHFHPLHVLNDSNNEYFNDSNDTTNNINYTKNNSTSQDFCEAHNSLFYQINHTDKKIDDLVEDNIDKNNSSSKIFPQYLYDIKANKKNLTNNFQNRDITNSCLETKLSQSTKYKFINESNSNNSNIKDEYKTKIEHQAKKEQEQGNKCFKKKQYILAIECYTKSIGYASTNAAVFANRALCFINLHEYEKALKDSSKAIQIDPSYTKAYHRRALAAHKLGNLEDALRDYQILATYLRNDKSIQREIKDIESQIQNITNTNENFQVVNKSQSILTSEVCENDDVILKPIKTTIYKNEYKSPTIQQENVQSYLNTKNTCNDDKLFDKSDSIIKGNIAKHTTPKKVFKSIENIKITIPQKPTSALEFERVCNSLKDNPNLAKEYVKSIEFYKYPILFKESLSTSIMQCFIHILRNGFMPNDPRGAINVLRGLTKIKRFLLILLLISSSDKQGLDTLFYWLEYSSEIHADEIQELRRIYQIL